MIFWTFHAFGSQVSQIYQTLQIQNIITTHLSQYTSLILPLLGAYLFTVFYLAGSKYYKNEGDQRNPKSNVIMEVSKIIQFTMPVYIGYLLIAIFPKANSFWVGIGGLAYYGGLMGVSSLLSGSKNFLKLFVIPLGGIAVYLALTKGQVYSELALMSLLSLYVHIVDNATGKYYEVFTKNYQTIAENYLNLKDSSQALLDSFVSDQEDQGEKIATTLRHIMLSATTNVGLIKGGNFLIFLIILTAIYTLNLSAFAVVYLLAVYPLTVVRIPLLEYQPKGPVNFIERDYEAVFITDENDRDGYYTIITPEGEKKIRTDNIEGFETYSNDEEVFELLRNKLGGED